MRRYQVILQAVQTHSASRAFLFPRPLSSWGDRGPEVSLLLVLLVVVRDVGQLSSLPCPRRRRSRS